MQTNKDSERAHKFFSEFLTCISVNMAMRWQPRDVTKGVLILDQLMVRCTFVARHQPFNIMSRTILFYYCIKVVSDFVFGHCDKKPSDFRCAQLSEIGAFPISHSGGGVTGGGGGAREC
jgi:hypothetical protein